MKATHWVLVGVTLALVAFDIYVFLAPPPGDTISEVVLGVAREHPALPFLLGVLMGHLLWPQQIVKQGG